MKKKLRAGTYCRARRSAPVEHRKETGSILCDDETAAGSYSVAHSRPANTTFIVSTKVALSIEKHIEYTDIEQHLNATQPDLAVAKRDRFDRGERGSNLILIKVLLHAVNTVSAESTENK